MNYEKTNCTHSNLYQCWDCKRNCLIKHVLLFPEFFFWLILNIWYHTTIEYMVSSGISIEDAEYSQRLRIMSLVSTRIKMFGNLVLLNDD